MTRSLAMLLPVLIAMTATGSAQVLFSESFDNNSAGWSLDASWQIGPAVLWTPAGPCGNGDPGDDGDGVIGGGVAGVVIGGAVPTTLTSGMQYLTSPPIDTTSLTSVNLIFDRYLNSDYTPYMQNSVEVWDGAAWQTIFLTGPPPSVLDTAWTNFVYDITPYSNTGLQVRFGYLVGSGGAYSTCGGWNLDNVQIAFAPCVPLGGQAPTGGVARFDINGALSICGNAVTSDQPGPYYASVTAVTGGLSISLEGAPNQPVVMLSGTLDPGVNPISPYGQLDLGTAGLGGLSIVAAGTAPGFLNSLFWTSPTGTQLITAQIPANLAGTILGLQCVMFHPTLIIQASNAVELTITP